MLSGINDVQAQYAEALKSDSVELDAKFIPILQFAYKVAQSMGLPDFVELDEVITPAKELGEVCWTIDEKLYLNAEEKDRSIQKKITQKLGGNTASEGARASSQTRGAGNFDTT